LTDVRIRLYRFLISFYRQGTWGVPPCPTEHESPSLDVLNPGGNIDPPLKPSGTPPKSPARIRATIKSLHLAQGNAIQPGPFASKTRDEQGIWVAVGTVRRQRNVMRFIGLRLDWTGIPYRIETIDRHRVVIRVPLPFKDNAQQIVHDLSPATISLHIRSDPFNEWLVVIPIVIVLLVWLTLGSAVALPLAIAIYLLSVTAFFYVRLH
jgi:hypothetical protein